MKRLAEQIEGRAASPRPDQAEAKAHVLALVAEWAAGRLPLWEVRKQSTGKDRFYAAWTTPPSDPRFRDLHRCLDALIAEHQDPKEGFRYDTKHGSFSSADLAAAKATIDQRDGRQRIRFPIRQPWRKRPDPHGATEEARQGVRDDPVYAEDGRERWEIANDLRRSPRADDKRRRWDP